MTKQSGNILVVKMVQKVTAQCIQAIRKMQSPHYRKKKAMHEGSKFITNFKDSEAMRLFPSVSHL